jgi:hypothetical protein
LAQIIGGSVKFGRKTAPAQYENKEAVVELSFSLAEGEALGTFLDDVGAQAQAKALEMVGLKPVEKTKPALTKEVKAELDAFKEETEKQKAKEAYANGKATDADLKAKEAAKALAEKCNTAKDIASLDVVPTVQPASDPDADLLADVPKEVTDQDLVAAVTRKNQELKDPKKIHALRETFVKLPKGLRDIVAADRPRFLAELEALKK